MGFFPGILLCVNASTLTVHRKPPFLCLYFVHFWLCIDVAWWVIPRFVLSVSVRSKWAGLGAQKGPLLHPNRCPVNVSVSLSFPMRFLQGKRFWGGLAQWLSPSFPRTHDRRTHDSGGVRFGLFWGAFYNSTHRGVPKWQQQ